MELAVQASEEELVYKLLETGCSVDGGARSLPLAVLTEYNALMADGGDQSERASLLYRVIVHEYIPHAVVCC